MNGIDRLSTLWATGQILPRVQRGDLYASASRAHPAKMWPHTAAHAVAAFSRPGDWVLDPMCGIGTTMIEAIRLGRAAVGIDCEPDWVAAASANLHLAKQAIPGVKGSVRLGDARRLARHVPRRLIGRIDLVVTSPPYGKAAHGRAFTRRETGGAIAKRDYTYSTGRPDPQQLARADLGGLLEGLGEVFTGCHRVLKRGGIMVLACRPFAHAGMLVDFPAELTDVCQQIGFRLQGRCAALLAEWDADFGLRPIHSFFGLYNTRASIERGRLALLRSHEDLLVFVKEET
ncbi:TRM11 family SAM-dependent methyltransferase [Glycomyces sp. MUSA5-2]|uniref:TRM11 family SAM-dependent methyltransferase n=1 Tax=Glycomyces sp. MUSA5-2 TaxID=2053002 RepID=UPI00300AF9AD